MKGERNYFTLTPKPAGGRDLYWCKILREPVILEYDDNDGQCTGCNMTIPLDMVDEEYDLPEHQFVGHLLRDVK